MIEQRLANKVAIVVGGGQIPGEDVGNGRAAALTFARHGAQVLVVDKDGDAAQETADQIVAAGGESSAVVADVTVDHQVVAAIQACSARYGRVDILHNNVGVGGPSFGDGDIAEIDVEAFDRILSINLRGMVVACRHTLPVMRAQRSGVIVNVGSIATMLAKSKAAYRISKAGVITLTKHIAITNAEYGIRANVVLPGLVNTPMAVVPRIKAGSSRDAVIADRVSQIPLSGVIGTGWDVAKAALFLASDEAAFITGAELVVDGGQTLRVG